MESFLELQGVRVGFPIQKGIFRRTHGHKIVLDSVSFKIARGKTVGLVGESGSGKTTIGRAILGLVPVMAGSIPLYLDDPLISREPLDLAQGFPDDFDPSTGQVRSLSRMLRRRLQIIFQDPYSSLNPRLRIGDVLLEAMHLHFPEMTEALRRKKAKDTLDRVGLSDSALERYPHEFSGGQRQRISIARALVLDPQFIVCDECVSALDVSIQAQILNLLRDLQEERRLTYLFISHDLSVVRYISHEICVLDRGRIVEQGEASRVVDQPVEPYTKRLLEAVPSLIPRR